MKTSKKLLSLSLSAALVFTTVFAGAESIFAETSVTEKDCPAPLELAENCTLDFENAETAGAVKATGVNASLQAMTEMQSVTAVNINTTTEANAYKTGLYDRNNLWSIPVKIPAAGNFLINLVSTGNNNVYLFDTPNPDADTKPIAAMALPASQSDSDIYSFSARVAKAGTYYLVFATDSYSSIQTALQVFYAKALKSGSSTAVTSGKVRYASVSGTGYRYFKITVPGTRYLRIDIPWGDGGQDAAYKIKLMNSSKKKNLLKGIVNLKKDGRGYTTYAGVPKGTYYVAVSTATDSAYSIKVTSTKVTDKSGSTRSKANRMYKGNSRSGIITATQSSSSGDWYKLVLGSTQRVELGIITKSGGYSGGIKFSVYSGSKTKAFGTAEYYYGEPNGTLHLYTSGYGDRLVKGTYYIKVQKYGSGSGYYKLKWK
ncbi:MAG: hypothetical protein UC961_07810 [Emergencia sp.]|nr:hypothetical protein [Emergencia sp.]